MSSPARTADSVSSPVATLATRKNSRWPSRFQACGKLSSPMSEVGKAAKRMGHVHPRVLRRTEVSPARVTPAREVRTIAKPFGFSYECGLIGRWRRSFEWFKTERSRDQALAIFERRHEGSRWFRAIRKEERAHSRA